MGRVFIAGVIILFTVPLSAALADDCNWVPPNGAPASSAATAIHPELVSINNQINPTCATEIMKFPNVIVDSSPNLLFPDQTQKTVSAYFCTGMIQCGSLPAALKICPARMDPTTQNFGCPSAQDCANPSQLPSNAKLQTTTNQNTTWNNSAYASNQSRDGETVLSQPTAFIVYTSGSNPQPKGGFCVGYASLSGSPPELKECFVDDSGICPQTLEKCNTKGPIKNTSSCFYPTIANGAPVGVTQVAPSDNTPPGGTGLPAGEAN